MGKLNLFNNKTQYTPGTSSQVSYVKEENKVYYDTGTAKDSSSSTLHGKFEAVVVSELPAIENASPSVIYLIPNGSDSEGNQYTEYVLNGTTFEQIGDGSKSGTDLQYYSEDEDGAVIRVSESEGKQSNFTVGGQSIIFNSGDATNGIKTCNMSVEPYRIRMRITDTEVGEHTVIFSPSGFIYDTNEVATKADFKTINGESIIGEGDITVGNDSEPTWQQVAKDNPQYIPVELAQGAIGTADMGELWYETNKVRVNGVEYECPSIVYAGMPGYGNNKIDAQGNLTVEDGDIPFAYFNFEGFLAVAHNQDFQITSFEFIVSELELCPQEYIESSLGNANLKEDLEFLDSKSLGKKEFGEHVYITLPETGMTLNGILTNIPVQEGLTFNITNIRYEGDIQYKDLSEPSEEMIMSKDEANTLLHYPLNFSGVLGSGDTGLELPGNICAENSDTYQCLLDFGLGYMVYVDDIGFELSREPFISYPLKLEINSTVSPDYVESSLGNNSLREDIEQLKNPEWDSLVGDINEVITCNELALLTFEDGSVYGTKIPFDAPFDPNNPPEINLTNLRASGQILGLPEATINPVIQSMFQEVSPWVAGEGADLWKSTIIGEDIQIIAKSGIDYGVLCWGIRSEQEYLNSGDGILFIDKIAPKLQWKGVELYLSDRGSCFNLDRPFDSKNPPTLYFKDITFLHDWLDDAHHILATKEDLIQRLGSKKDQVVSQWVDGEEFGFIEGCWFAPIFEENGNVLIRVCGFESLPQLFVQMETDHFVGGQLIDFKVGIQKERNLCPPSYIASSLGNKSLKEDIKQLKGDLPNYHLNDLTPDPDFGFLVLPVDIFSGEDCTVSFTLNGTTYKTVESRNIVMAELFKVFKLANEGYQLLGDSGYSPLYVVTMYEGPGKLAVFAYVYCVAYGLNYYKFNRIVNPITLETADEEVNSYVLAALNIFSDVNRYERYEDSTTAKNICLGNLITNYTQPVNTLRIVNARNIREEIMKFTVADEGLTINLVDNPITTEGFEDFEPGETYVVAINSGIVTKQKVEV